MAKTKEPEVKTHFAWGEHWREAPECEGFMPSDKRMWQSIKDDFNIQQKYSNDNPLFLHIIRGNEIIPVWVCGFRIPEKPLVIRLGTNAAIQGRFVFCKTDFNRECIAIPW